MTKQRRARIAVTVLGLLLLLLLSACAGVGSSIGANGAVTQITGTITSVDPSNHSVTLTVNGTTYTVNGLSDQQVQALESQKGQTYTVQVTQNSDGSYSLTVGTNPAPASNQTPGVSTTPEASETPEAGETPEASETPSSSTGSLTVIALAQSVSSSSLTVTLPDSTALTIGINAQTDLSDLNGTLSNGQKVKVEASASSSGLVATKIKAADSGDDVNTAEFVGVTTQKVGSDQRLHFTLGKQSFNYALAANADLGDFQNSAANIASGQTVKVKVQYSNGQGSIIKVSSSD